MAQTRTNSLLVVLPYFTQLSAPHRHGTAALQRSSFSFEIIIVNSELTIVSFRNFLQIASNNNNLTAFVPVFMGSDFCLWEQKMGDYLKSQRLWCLVTGNSVCPVEAVAGTPTVAKLQAQALWDKSNKQVQGIIGSQISQMLHSCLCSQYSCKHLSEMETQPVVLTH